MISCAHVIPRIGHTLWLHDIDKVLIVVYVYIIILKDISLIVARYVIKHC